MYVIYTIITISTTGILINLFECLIHWQFIPKPVLQPNPSEHDMRVPLSERESDQITSISDVTIIYDVLFC